MNSYASVRTRFAPSPTGYVHLGSVRTALYNYLFAKQRNGCYVLRIEDTDQSRKVDGALENLVEVMSRLGLDHDEGPGHEGDHGPYLQSQRLSLYSQKIKFLVESGHAYYCFCSSERLSNLREEQKSQNAAIGYDRKCRHLTETEVVNKLKADTEYVIRLKVPDNETITFEDLIRGKLEFDSNLIDDQVLIKSDGFPTYHFANVVDDHEMQISHVIRGEEWVTSTPKHILLYNAFAWTPPHFAHLPLLLNPDRSKLSKRQGDVAVEDFLKAQFSEETLINYLALLGWSPGDDQEFFSLNDLIEQFQLEKVSKSGAVFDRDKLSWMNSQYIKNHLPEKRFLDLVKPFVDIEELKSWNPVVLDRVILTLRNQLDKPEDIQELLAFFIKKPDISILKNSDCAQILSLDTNEKLFSFISSRIEILDTLSSDSLREITRSAQKELGVKGKALFMPLRVALTGATSGPEVFVFAEGLGREECLQRLEVARQVHIELLGESQACDCR